MAKKKPNTIFYHDWYVAFARMSDADAGKLFKALMLWDIDGTEPGFEQGTVLDILFVQYSNAIYKNRLAYEATCERRSKAAKEREAKKTQESQDSTNDHNCADRGTETTISTDNKYEYEYESKYDSEYESNNNSNNKSNNGRFKPPTVEDVMIYCTTAGLFVDAEEFVDFYSSKNWMVGKNKMSDWKAAVRNWARKNKPKQTQQDEMRSWI